MHRFRAVLAVGLLIAVAGTVPAQTRSKVTIDDARIGFPAGAGFGDGDDGSKGTIFKAGSWAPVFVTLTPNTKLDGNPDLLIETADSDDLVTAYPVTVQGTEPGSTITVIGYTKPGSNFSDLTVRVRLKGEDLSPPRRVQVFNGIDSSQFLYLAIGSRLPGMKLPGQTGEQDKDMNLPLSLAACRSVEDLPTQWFGYSGVDLAILTTGNREFMQAFQSDRTGRRSALAEWVRRGGRLVVSTGANPGELAAIEEFRGLLPATVGVGRQESSLALRWWSNAAVPAKNPLGYSNRPGTTFPLADLSAPAGREVPAFRVLMAHPLATSEKPRSPLIVQGGYGLGRVTLVGFDLDTMPFTGWDGTTEFWKVLLGIAGYTLPEPRSVDMPRFQRGISFDGQDDALTRLQTNLETFMDVPVISFGWVALFILVYILIIGPLDYWFLKSVVKRLELTWVTFPTVVLIVSAAAYFAAYALKGDELKVNKIDLVEVDLLGKESFGNTWFTVFSPRIQNYTVGIEPAAPAWAAGPRRGEPLPLVSWLGRARQGRQSLFRRSYEYAPQGAGLKNVPIQVWSTKGFTASWRSPFDPAKPPVEADVRRAAGSDRMAIGSLTNRLPEKLTEAQFLYAGRVYPLGELLPDDRRQLTLAAGMPMSEWLKQEGWGSTAAPSPGGMARGQVEQATVNLSLWPILFRETVDSSSGNTGLRELDQSWRATDHNLTEAILIGRLAQQTGAGEEVTASGSSPTRLWLGALPDGTATRPTLAGTMRQDTFVRVYIPVEPAGK